MTASCLIIFFGSARARTMHLVPTAMRYDEDDPKRPPPTPVRRKGDNWWERQEYEVGPAHKDDERDRHRHVRS